MRQITRGRDCTDLEDVYNHVPLTTIADEVVCKEVDESVIHRKVSVLDGQLKVVVGLVKLVPEEEV